MEDRDQGIFDGAPFGIVLVDQGSLIVATNPRFDEMLGYDRRELVGRPLGAVIPERHRVGHLRHEAQFHETQRVARPMGARVGLTALRRDGREIPVEVALTSVLVGGARLTSAFVVDITERVRIEGQLRESEERARLLFEHAPEAIMVVDAATVRVVDANPSAVRLFELTGERLLGKQVEELSAPVQPNGRSSAELIAEALVQIASGAEPVFEWLHRTGTGRLVSCEVRLTKLPGANVQIRASIIDISKRKLAERRYQTLFEGANDAIIVLNSEGEIVECNNNLSTLFGWTREAVVGKSFLQFVEPHDAQAEWRRFLEAGRVGTLHLENVPTKRADGRKLVVDVSASIADLGEERLLLVVLRDVTARNLLQAQLQLSDRMVSVGTLAAGVAHEINNPLAAVIANLELATKDLAEVAKETGPLIALTELVEELEDASHAADRVRLIIRDLKLFSRAEEDRTAAVDVVRVLESSLRMAWNEIRHRARLVKDFTKLPPVEVNEARLGQVFLNLIVNAAQAIPDGRSDDNLIRVSTRLDELGRVAVDISDSGSGMSPETLGRLFTPFFTTKPPGVGTGLGLSISQRIVMTAGGEITVQSAIGRGTIFTVHLPVARAEIVDQACEAKVVRAGARRGRVLVVDDEPSIASAIRRVLQADHDVEVETCGAVALERLRGGAVFDVIVSDVMMPQVSGMELFARLGEIDPSQVHKILFLTGGAFTSSAREFLDGISNLRMEKPFDPSALRAMVNSMVHL